VELRGLKTTDREAAAALLAGELGWAPAGAASAVERGAWAAYEAEALQGILMVSRVLDEAEVIALVVRPEARRRGVARALLRAFLGTLEPEVRVFLEVADGNAAAHGLYASEGFEESHRRVAYYRDGTDALVLVRASAPAAEGRQDDEEQDGQPDPGRQGQGAKPPGPEAVPEGETAEAPDHHGDEGGHP
jgi:ribosomal protein S18 acetylase RimI-like enzyme